MNCAGFGRVEYNGYTNKLLKKHIASFEKDFGVDVNYKVIFVKNFQYEPSPTAIASCTVYNNGYKVVQISAEYEKSKSLLQIVYHELGHCSLNIKHYEDAFDIMNPRLSHLVDSQFKLFKKQMIYNWKNKIYKLSK